MLGHKVQQSDHSFNWSSKKLLTDVYLMSANRNPSLAWFCSRDLYVLWPTVAPKRMWTWWLRVLIIVNSLVLSLIMVASRSFGCVSWAVLNVLFHLLESLFPAACANSQRSVCPLWLRAYSFVNLLSSSCASRRQSQICSIWRLLTSPSLSHRWDLTSDVRTTQEKFERGTQWSSCVDQSDPLYVLPLISIHFEHLSTSSHFPIWLIRPAAKYKAISSASSDRVQHASTQTGTKLITLKSMNLYNIPSTNSCHGRRWEERNLNILSSDSEVSPRKT